MALSPVVQAQVDAMRAELRRRNAEHVPQYSIAGLKLEEVEDLAAGLVPLTIKAQARMLLDIEDHRRRNAERPIRTKARKGETRR